MRVLRRRDICSACSTRSRSRPRLGRLVSRSWRARWVMSSVSRSRAKASEETATIASRACWSAVVVDRARCRAGRHDPAVPLPVAQLGAHLVGARRRGPDLDLPDPQQPLRVVDERVDDLAGVGEGLGADRGVEEHAEPAGVLAAAGDRAGGHQQGRQRHGEQEQGPPRVARRPRRRGSPGSRRARSRRSPASVPRCTRWPRDRRCRSRRRPTPRRARSRWRSTPRPPAPRRAARRGR